MYFAALLATVSIGAAESEKPTGMPAELSRRIDEGLLGEWKYEITWSDKTILGEETVRWARKKAGILIQGTMVTDGKKSDYVTLLGWNGAEKALVGRGFNSEGDEWMNCWSQLGKDKWTGQGSGTFAGKKWESAVSLEFKKDSLRYEDVTEGKPWIGVYTRVAKPAR